MRLLSTLDHLADACAEGVAMTIGVFDGVHRGHQMLIRRARDQARMRAVRSLVFTFERHPLAHLAPAYCPKTLTQPAEKARLIEELEVDLCLMLPFTGDFAAIPSGDFIERVLVGLCRVRYIVCGWNFSFGAGGQGNTDLLKRRGLELGFDTEIVDPLSAGVSPISSTGIRHYLLQGQTREAERLLMRPYGFEAEVVAGHGRGRQIGYPTANLQVPPNQLIPADGVYAVQVVSGGFLRGGMLNIGNRPTFEGAGRAMEVHLFDFSGDLNGQTVRMEFLERTRDERKFSGVDELVAQLKMDEAACRAIWEESRKAVA